MRVALAVILLAHGVAHVVGFVVAWRIWTLPEVPYRTTILAGSIEVGADGTRALGVAWLVTALAFAAMVVAVLLRLAWWTQLGLWPLLLSLMLCVIGWPDSRLGVVANVVIGGLVLAGIHLGWLPVGPA